MIEGSGCLSPRQTGFDQLYKVAPDSAYARLIVLKSGVDESNSICSKEFLQSYSIITRTQDHLRSLQYLRKHADWWNGEVYIWGWSDGAMIGAQLVAYDPTISKAALGGLAGGHTIEEFFQDKWACPADRLGENRAACLAQLDEQFGQITNNPTWQKTWSGSENSYKLWDSRLPFRASNLLVDTQTPLLIIHGAEDKMSAHVDGARKLVQELEQHNHPDFEYWEIQNMAHNWSQGRMTKKEQAILVDAMKAWL